MSTTEISYLNQMEATQLDEQLMGEYSYSIDQLMELAGLSVASAVQMEYPVSQFQRVLVIVGPGNNGGDGLVAARHLTLFGHAVQICIPNPTNNLLYNNLRVQCEAMGVQDAPIGLFRDGGKHLKDDYDMIVDAIFGFSFKGNPRAPFDQILETLRPDMKPPALVSIDIPSGWNVERGDQDGNGIQPDMLVSLSAPKPCAKQFKGLHHYLGGRFLPPPLIEHFKLKLPKYPGNSQCVKLNKQTSPAIRMQDLRIVYRQPPLEEDMMLSDPFAQFHVWFNAYVDLDSDAEPNAIVLATCGKDLQPSARTVLLKRVEENGFVFFSNYESKKGMDLAENVQAALCMYLPAMHRQIRIEGKVQKLSESASEAYFQSRPRSSQIGAWASNQSTILANRAELHQKMKALEQRYADEKVIIPKPPYWGGYLLVPEIVEFWQGNEGRLHDRLEYYRDAVSGDWMLRRLSP